VTFFMSLLVAFDGTGRQQTVAAGDDDRKLLACQRLLDAGAHLCWVQGGIENGDMLDAESARQRLEADLARGLVAEGASSARMFLQPGHRGGPVVEDEQHVPSFGWVVD